MRTWTMLTCMAVALLVSCAAHAQTRVELLGTWPAGDSVTLGRHQAFYLHLRYTSDVPIGIWTQPLFEGKPVSAGTNPSRTYPAGTGEALGWFFLQDPDAQVDEVQISAGSGSVDGTPVVATFPVAVSAGDGAGNAAAQPSWLSSLRAADEAAQRAAYEKSMNTPFSTTDVLLVQGFMLGMLAIGLLALLGPFWGLLRWRGGWRIAAALPLVVMGFVILRIIFDGLRDPTSHNLWPFEILMWGLPGCLWTLVLLVAHRVTVRRA